MNTKYMTMVGKHFELTEEGKTFLRDNYESHTNKWVREQMGISCNEILKRLLFEAGIKKKREHRSKLNKKYVTIVGGKGTKTVLNEAGRKYVYEHRADTNFDEFFEVFGVHSQTFKRHIKEVCIEMGCEVKRAKRKRYKHNDGRDEELKAGILELYRTKSVCEMGRELHSSVMRIRSLMVEMNIFRAYRNRIKAKNRKLIKSCREKREYRFNFSPKRKKVTQKESVLLTAKEKKVLGVKSLKGIESQADIIKKFDTIVRNEEWRLEVSKGIKLYATFYLRDKGREKAIRERYGKEYEYRLTRIDKHEGQGQGADGAA